MKNLRKSAFTKVLAVFLCVVSLVSIAANGVLLAYMMYNNLYSNDKDALARKVYNVLAADTAQDVYDYVKAKLRAEDPEEDQDYWINQALIYESALSNNYSNASFKVFDEKGNELLSGYELPEYSYEYTYKYVYWNETYVYDELTTYTEAYSNHSGTVYETTTFDETSEESTTNLIKSQEEASDETTVTEELTSVPDSTVSETAEEQASSVQEEESFSEVTFDSFAYDARTKEFTYFTVTIFVPQSPEKASDLYALASDLIDFLFDYKEFAVTLIVVSLIIFVLSLFLLFSSAGYTKGSDKPIANGLHKIPFDISLVIVFCITLAYIYFLDEVFYISDFFTIVLFVITTVAMFGIYLAFAESIAVRIKTKTILSNNLIIHFVKICKSGIALASKNISLTWKTVLVFCGISIVELFALLFCLDDSTFGIFLYIVLKLVEIPAVFLTVYALSLLQQGAKKIADGETDYKIEHKILIGEFKKHADSLNNINIAVNKAVEERVKSENMKTELITNVSHDLKTPLTSIVNYIDLLKKTDVENETAKEYIEVIDRQAQRLKKLTVDIVDASKAATGTIEVHNEKTLLNILLSQVNGEYSELLENNKLTLIQEVPEKDVCIFADGRLLWRVFDNLFNNICKYSQSYTRVYLTLKDLNGKAEVTFRNISSSPLNVQPEALTERFVRGDSSRNTEGSGLGLSIAKSLCELMGADFRITIDGDLFKVTITFNTID